MFSESIVLDLITKSLELLDKKHEMLLCSQINEPCINHHFANCIQLNLDNKYGQQVMVDCEYNKNLTSDIEKEILLTEEDAKRFIKNYSRIKNRKTRLEKLVRSVIPDIIVHERNKQNEKNGKNYLVIETKKKSNPNSLAKSYDRFKLQRFTRSDCDPGVKYEFGAYIEFDDQSSSGEQRKHLIEIYRCGSIIERIP